jgi:hypothetical protein
LAIIDCRLKKVSGRKRAKQYRQRELKREAQK